MTVMDEIIHGSTATFLLAGDVAADSLPQLSALVRDARERDLRVVLDLGCVDGICGEADRQLSAWRAEGVRLYHSPLLVRC